MMYRQRKAFSMITAIFVIVIMASVAGFVMNLSGKMVQETTSQYQKEQAVLLAKSYTEFAIMTVMSNDRNGTGNCISDIDADDIIPIDAPTATAQGYRIRTRIGFIGQSTNIGSCFNTRKLGYPVTTTSDDLNIIVDVYVEYQALDNPLGTGAPWITYHRRTLQKI